MITVLCHNVSRHAASWCDDLRCRAAELLAKVTAKQMTEADLSRTLIRHIDRIDTEQVGGFEG